MPETRIQKMRQSLPEGYQFGNATKPSVVIGRSGAVFLFDDEALAERFSEVTAKRLRARDWNVIEGEHHE